MKPTNSLWATPLLALALSALAACGGEGDKHDKNAAQGDKSAAQAASGAAFDPATKRAIALTTLTDLKPVSGRYTTSDEAVARARTGGTLVRLLVDEGSEVKAGQLLAVIDEARMGAEIAARQAGANAAGSVAGAGQYGAMAAQAEIARAQALAAQAPAALEQAKAAQARAQADYSRTKTLYDQGVYAKARLDQMEAGRRVSDAQVRAAEAGVRAAQQGVNTAQAQAEVALAQARATKDQAAAARAQTAIASAMRAEGNIIAPRTGRVTAVPVTQGGVLMPGEIVAIIAGGEPVLKLSVPEADATNLRLGQTLSLNDETGASVGQAAIVKIYPSVRNGQIDVDLASDGPQERFVGRRIGVLLPVGKRQGIAVPTSYVRTRAGIDYARILRGQMALEVPIQRGSAQGDMLEVLAGLMVGDVIVAYADEKPDAGAKP